MGLTSSRTVIPIKEAHAKLGHSTLIKLEKAYGRITDSNMGDSRSLDIKAFQRNFLEAFPLMPKMLVEALFDAFGASRRGSVTFEEFICSVAVMHMGTAPEQLRMLFEVYDTRRTGYIEIDHLRRLLDAIYGRNCAKKVDKSLEWLFLAASGDDGMDAEEFIGRLKPVVDYRGSVEAAHAEPLLQWFRALCTRILHEPDPAVVALEQRYNPDRDLNKVAMKYKLSPGLTDSLYRRHAIICRRSSTNSLDVQEWLSVVGYLIPETLGRRVFQLFAQLGGLAWTVADFITFLCVCVLDSRQEHVSVMFQLFDMDRDGLLTEDEVATMLQNLALHHAHRAAGCDGSNSYGGIHYRGHRHQLHQGSHQLDQASLLLGLRKLGYENLADVDTNTSSAAGNGGGDCGSDSCSITKAVARRLLKDMLTTSDKYVAFPTSEGYSRAGYPASASSRPWSEKQQQQRRQKRHPAAGSATPSPTTPSTRSPTFPAEDEGGWDVTAAPAVTPGAVAEEDDGTAVDDARGKGEPGERELGSREGSENVGGLTLAGFMAWSSVHGGRMMLMKDLVYACLAEFGMRPAKAVQEREVVMEIFRRHEASFRDPDGFPFGPEGTRWAVINAQWWSQWREYARMPSETQQPSRAPPALERPQKDRKLAPAVGDGRSLDPSPSTTAASSPSSYSSSTRSRASSRVFGSATVLGSIKSSRVVGGGAGGRVGGMGTVAVGGARAGGGGGGGAAGGVVSAYLSAPSSVATQAPRPSQIHNQPLLEHGGSRRLMRVARIGQDFKMIPPKAWDALQAWYDGGPPLERRVINYHGRLELELFPMSLKVASCDIRGKPRQFERELLLSKVDKVLDLTKQLAEANKVEPDRARLWNYADRVDWKKQHVLSPSHTLEEAKLVDGQLVLLEISQQDGAWPRSQLQSMLEAEEEEAQAESAKASAGGKGRGTRAIGDGLVGLGNLGNTCYINSSVQCLSHTPLLTEYFLSGSYVNDVNVENKLGLQGRLAHVYADLVNDLWSPTKKTVTPKLFKNELAKFNDLFGGHDQHDAQELLAFLLNGLNEDLNRIADKPYIEQPDSDGRPDAELADIWWKHHLRREFSIVVALFAGQFKSLLVCRECGYESARFEPFMFLQLPLPEDTERAVAVFVVLLDGAKCPVKVSLRLPKAGRVSDLMRAVVNTFNAPPPERKRNRLSTDAKSAGKTKLDPERQSSLPVQGKEDDPTTIAEHLEVAEGAALANEEAVAGAVAGHEDARAGEDVEEEEDEDEPNLAEERSFYTRLGLRSEDLAVADINSNKVFSIIPPDRTLQSIRENDVFYVYELERDAYGEQEAANATAAAAAAAVAAEKPIAASTSESSFLQPEKDEEIDFMLHAGGERGLGPVSTKQDSSLGGEARKVTAAVVAGGGEDAARKYVDPGTPDERLHRRDTNDRLEIDGQGECEQPSGAVVAAVTSAPPAADIDPASVVVEQHAGDSDLMEHRANGVGGRCSGVRPAAASSKFSSEKDPLGLSAPEAPTGSGKSTSSAKLGSSGSGSSVSESSKPSASKPMEQIRMPPRLFAVIHRRLDKKRNFLACPYQVDVFGTPLVCRVVPMTGRQLYDKLYRRFYRFLRLRTGAVSAPFAESGGACHAGIALFKEGEAADWNRCGVAGEDGASVGVGDYDRDLRPCMGTSEDEKCPRSVRSTSMWVAAGEVNRWGFRLRLVTSHGNACSRCSWIDGCVGCFIRPNDEPCPVKAGDTLCVDWHISVVKEHYDTGEAMSCLLHSNIAYHKDLESRPLSLEKCLDTFTQQEDIKEGYCSRCKEFRNASKKMDVWRLPPILAIQLKRFQYTQYSRRKLRNNVHFPVKGLDLSPYLVIDPSGGNSSSLKMVGEGEGKHMSREDAHVQHLPRHNPPQAAENSESSMGVPGTTAGTAARTPTLVMKGDSFGRGMADAVPGKIAGDSRPNGGVDVNNAAAEVVECSGGRVHNEAATGRGAAASREKTVEPAELMEARGLAGGSSLAAGDYRGRSGFRGVAGGKGAGTAATGADTTGVYDSLHGGSHNHDVDDTLPSTTGMATPGVIGANGGRGDSLYDLYAVVHHLGALSSGHYVASVKSQTTSKWHYFNDNQVTEVGEDELGSSSSSAYILFYMRRDCTGLRIEDIYPSGPPKTVEEVEVLMLHRDTSKCSIM